MGERLIISGGGKVCAYTWPHWELAAMQVLEGAGALCADGRQIFAADQRGCAIWRLDRDTLTITGQYTGGPGVTQLMLSGDGRRLYALCSEADSLLMLSARNGAPMVLNRVGVNPCAMAMDERGEVIAVAGGACGEVLLLSAHSLNLVGRFAASGVVFGAAIVSGTVYALSLSETMDSVLTAFLPGGSRRELVLAGMPGTLAIVPEGVAAATHQAVYFALRDTGAVYRRISVPGRAGRLLIRPRGMLLTDTWSDSLFWRAAPSQAWKRIAGEVRDAALL